MKNKFVASTFVLLIGGALVKILGMIIKIIYTRFIGEYGIALYNLVMPTYSLILSIVIFSLPISISKLVSSNKYRSTSVGLSALYISVILNVLFIIIVSLFSGFIAKELLNEPLCKNLLLCLLATIPFVSLSSIIKGYFYGKQNMLPSTIGNIFEQICRLLLMLFILPIVVSINTYYGVMMLILLNIVSETVSIFVMYLFLPKKINLKEIKMSNDCTNDILKISIPNVSAKLIGNVSYFFEPIIITNLLLLLGYSKDYIVLEYGIYNSYAISLLLIPSFFVGAIASAIMPEIAKFVSSKNKYMIKKRIKEASFISLFLGIVFCYSILIFRDNFLQFLYGTTNASNYIKVIAPFFFLFYLEAPLSSILIALGGNKDTFFITFVGVIIKNIVLISCMYLGFAMYSLVVAEIINIILVVFLDIFAIKKLLKQY